MSEKYPIRSLTFKEGWDKSECPRCKESFWVIPSKVDTLKYCSEECRWPGAKERLLSRMVKTESGCWLFPHAPTKDGYGTLKVDGQMWRAHRLSYVVFVGPIPPGLGVLHTCIGTPACINPEHLYVGDQTQNLADCVAQGRHRFGERSPNCKLTDAQVLEIRGLRRKMTRDDMAAKFGVSKAAINNVLGDSAWTHLPNVTEAGRGGPTKVTPDNVREIRRRAAAGERGKDLAAAFKVSVATISMIVSRKRWPEIE